MTPTRDLSLFYADDDYRNNYAEMAMGGNVIVVTCGSTVVWL